MRVQVRFRMRSRWNEWKYEFGKSSVLNFPNKPNQDQDSNVSPAIYRVWYRRGTIIVEPFLASIPLLLLADVVTCSRYVYQTYMCVRLCEPWLHRLVYAHAYLPAWNTGIGECSIFSPFFVFVHSSTFTLSENGLPRSILWFSRNFSNGAFPGDLSWDIRLTNEYESCWIYLNPRTSLPDIIFHIF